MENQFQGYMNEDGEGGVFNGFKCKYFDSWFSCIYVRCADYFFPMKRTLFVAVLSVFFAHKCLLMLCSLHTTSTTRRWLLIRIRGGWFFAPRVTKEPAFLPAGTAPGGIEHLRKHGILNETIV